eukprot:scaffold3052_cov389-Prasinococcus_capsulatus_cf.AAC.2
MSAGLPRRIVKETQKLLSEPAPGISASPSEDNLRYFNVIILGPAQSPYEGGAFKLELFLPEEYPMAPPKVSLCSKPAPCRHPRPASVGQLVQHFDVRRRRLLSMGAAIHFEVLSSASHATGCVAGRICLDILKDKWSPALQIRTVLLSIQALLSAPNPDDPLDENIAKHWKSNEGEAMMTARQWTQMYAKQ